MLETWRWFGPKDPVSLENIIQAGASGIVTSLHEVATGDAWTEASVLARKALIESAGLSWAVVESIPLHNDIKTRTGDYQRFIENYKVSIRSVGAAGIPVVCYNFMPVVDWTRTNLMYRLPNASHALRFDITDFAAYDLYILERPHAEKSYQQQVLRKAKSRFETMSENEKNQLETNIIAGLPGGQNSYNRDSIRAAIQQFIDMGEDKFRENLIALLREIVPVAEEAGVRLAIHPDDPPFSLFGLPRIVSTAEDARILMQAVPSKCNGLTLCAGSFGARSDNNLVAMAKEFANNIHFVHLRNIKRESDGSFYESEHLDGDNDIVGLISVFLDEEKRRKSQGRKDFHIPMRADHGHLIGNEIDQNNTKPGYSFGGRLKGLAELRGVMHALEAKT